MNSPTNRGASPVKTHELADRTCAEVAMHRGGGRLGGHRGVRLVLENSLTHEWNTVSRQCGTVMRHFLHTRVFAAPATVAALALGVTVPAASRVLIPASRRAQRFTPSGAAATCPAVLLAPVAARADEHLAPASGTQKQSGIAHCSPRRGGLDDPRLPGNTALGAVRKCGSGRSLGRDRQVSAVRGCVSLLAESDLTPTHERRHRGCARCARAMGRQHRLRRETTIRPRQAHRDDSEQVRSDRYSQFTWPVRQITAHLRSHQHLAVPPRPRERARLLGAAGHDHQASRVLGVRHVPPGPFRRAHRALPRVHSRVAVSCSPRTAR